MAAIRIGRETVLELNSRVLADRNVEGRERAGRVYVIRQAKRSVRRGQQRADDALFANRRSRPFRVIVPRDRYSELVGGEIERRIDRGMPACAECPGDAHLDIAGDRNDPTEIADEHLFGDVASRVEKEDAINLEGAKMSREQCDRLVARNRNVRPCARAHLRERQWRHRRGRKWSGRAKGDAIVAKLVCANRPKRYPLTHQNRWRQNNMRRLDEGIPSYFQLAFLRRLG